MTKTTRKRLLVLLTAATVTVGGIGGAFYYRGVQAERRLMEARTQGMSLYEQGRLADALGSLSKYVSRHQSDKEALLAYGRSRALTPEPDGRHVTEGIAVLRRYLEIAPDDVATRKLLLDLYVKAGYGNEALSLAERMRKDNPQDLDALRARYVGLARLGRFEEVPAAATKYLDLKPTDLAAHWDLMDVLFYQGTDIGAYRKHVETYLPKIGTLADGVMDPRATLLKARLAAHENQRDVAEATLRQATLTALRGQGFVVDTDFVTRAADLYDRLSRFAEGQKFVEEAAKARPDDRELASALGVRLWAAGNIEGVIQRTEGLKAEDKTAPTPLLALRALSLVQSGRKDEAKIVVDGLAARGNDTVAVAWALALRAAYFRESITPLERQRDYKAAIARLGMPADPAALAVFRQLLGGVFKEVGEVDMAISQWQQAVEALPQWSVPYQQLVSVMMEQGNYVDARGYADQLYRRSPTVAHLSIFAEAATQELQRGANPELAKRLVTELNGAIKQVPDERGLIPPLVASLVATGQREEAIRLARINLGDKGLSPEIVWKLTDVALAARLGLEKEVDEARARVGAIAASDTPRTVFSRAMEMADAGKIPEGLALLEDSRAKTAGANAVTWELTIIRYLDETNNPTAIQRIKEFLKTHPDELQGHLAVLASRAAWNDRELVTTSIEKVRAMTGDNAITWRVAKAKMLLERPDGKEAGDRESAEAVVLLNGVVADAPRLVAPRLLLAKALKTVNAENAIAQYAAASALDPDTPAIALQLAQMMVQQGRREEAKSAILRVAESSRVSMGQRVKFAAILSQLGESRKAIELLRTVNASSEGVTSLGGRQAEADLFLRDATMARLLAKQPDRRREAADLFDKLIARGKPEVDLAIDASMLYAGLGEVEKGRSTLEKSLAGEPIEIAAVTRATFEERVGETDKAIAVLKEAIASKPSATLHAQLAGLLLRSARYEMASQEIAAGLAAYPGDEGLSVLARAKDALAAMKSRSDLRSLIAWVSQDPTIPGVIPTLDALRQGGYTLSGQPAQSRLREVTRTYPQFLPAHAMLIQSYLESHRKSEAADAATTCFAALPASAEAASIVTATYLAVGKPQEALGIARLWRKFAPDDPIQPDLAVAACQLELKDPRGAIETLKSYGRSNRPAVLLMTCRAMVAAGQSGDASALSGKIWRDRANLRPQLLAEISSGASLSAAGSSSALAVIDSLQSEPGLTPRDQFMLAQACYRVAVGSNDAAALTRSDQMLTTLNGQLQGQSLPSPVRMLWGEIKRRRGDLPEAEKQYRQVLTEDPSSAVAANNLADLLIQGEPETQRVREAVSLARNAVEVQKGVAEFHDTLARALRISGQNEAAAEAFRTSLSLAPERLDTLVGYASLLVEDGKTRDAASVLRQIEPLVTPAVGGTTKSELEKVRSAVRGIASTPG